MLKLMVDRHVPEGGKILVSGRNRFTIFINKMVQKQSSQGHIYEAMDGEALDLTGVTFSIRVRDMEIPASIAHRVGVPRDVPINAPEIIGYDPETGRDILGCAAVLLEKDASRYGFSTLDELVAHIKGLGLYGDRYAFFDDDAGMVEIFKFIKDRNRQRSYDREAERDYIAAKVLQEEYEE